MTGLVTSDAYTSHLTGDGHPESPDRVRAIVVRLRDTGLLERTVPIAPRPATEAELLRCHSAAYLRIVREDVAEGLHKLSTGDTPLSAQSLETALLAAGGVLAAVDTVMAGRVTNAAAIVRPPGHHATPTKNGRGRHSPASGNGRRSSVAARRRRCRPRRGKCAPAGGTRSTSCS